MMNDVRSTEYIDGKLRVGFNFNTYLYFEIPPLAFMGQIERASLILFKIPINTGQEPAHLQRGGYCICPLMDFFSAYSNWFLPPRSDESLCCQYEDHLRMSYTQIDVTQIVRAWIRNDPENKGLFLTASPDVRPIVYASDRYVLPGMRPFLRLTYSGFAPPLSVAECTVEAQAL